MMRSDNGICRPPAGRRMVTLAWSLFVLLTISGGDSLPWSTSHDGTMLGCTHDMCEVLTLTRIAVSALIEGDAPGPGALAPAWLEHQGTGQKSIDTLHRLGDVPTEEIMKESRVAIIDNCPKCSPSDPRLCLECSIPAGALLVLFPNEEDPPAATGEDGQEGDKAFPWLSASLAATKVLGDDLVQMVKRAGEAVEGYTGSKFAFTLNVDVDETLFAPQGPLEQAAGIFFIRESKLAINPRMALRVSAYLEDPAHRSSLERHYGVLTELLRHEQDLNPVNFTTGSLSSLVSLRRMPLPTTTSFLLQLLKSSSQHFEDLNLQALHNLTSIPIKCLVCIVVMGTLVPLAVNVVLQGLGIAYCAARGLTPEECDKVRFMMFGIGIALTPLEIIPMALACTSNHKCKEEYKKDVAR